jgi:aryl-alcohol dehydrogenase-like predicted oxidoreductase
MRYLLFGRSGLPDSELCLGTMTFGDGSGWTADAAASSAIFDAFAEAGGTFIDTANTYTGGMSERLTGEFVRTQRDHFVVATKYTQGAHISVTGNSRRAMVLAVEASLKRLGLEHIDLLWLRIWDFTTPLDELMRAFDDLVAAGKILYAGASDMMAWEISRANMLADLRGWAPFIGVQLEYNLVQRTPERDLLPMAKALDLGVVAWAPLAAGLLSRPCDPSVLPKRAGRGTTLRTPNAAQQAIVQAVVQIANRLGRTPAEASLAWIRSQGRFPRLVPILGARTGDQLRANLNCVNLTLEPLDIARLDELSAIDLGFPTTRSAAGACARG